MKLKIIIIVFAIFLVLFIFLDILFCIGIIFFTGRITISNDSMVPNMLTTDKVYTHKLYPVIDSLKRGDIIIFNHIVEKDNQETEMVFIRRIIGIPGEEIEIKNNKGVYINGKLLIEPYLAEGSKNICKKEDPYCGPITLAKDFYYVMGDNRNISMDSRYFGPVKFNEISGKAFYIFWPNNRKGSIKSPNYKFKQDKI